MRGFLVFSGLGTSVKGSKGGLWFQKGFRFGYLHPLMLVAEQP